MLGVTIQQLQCFEAVADQGGLQAAARKLGRTHPSLSAAIRALESQLGLTLFDRGGYRMILTDEGGVVLEEARTLLRRLSALKTHAAQLALGEETRLRVVIGDLCPLPATLSLLRDFFAEAPSTRLDLAFEALGGPAERLFEDEADLIFHHVDKADPRLEFVDLGDVRLIPVCAAGYGPAQIAGPITAERVGEWTQCVIRDSARVGEGANYYLVGGARRLTVSDQLMKLEVILQGMGWGHMPAFLVEEKLADGCLRSLACEAFPGGRLALVAARRRDRPHGPVSQRLWARLSSLACQPRRNGPSPDAGVGAEG
ncbi:MAG TPA: LysR family transcriptional regulator [Allosphingosinicella sp.]|jgi:DNA-binding transcriptional LysR family regulator